MDDLTRWFTLPEGQFFDRKSAFDRSGSRHKQRKASDIAWDIVETLSAMANADGGELVVGIEDDGAVTGVSHPADKVGLLLRTPGDRNYIHPPLRYQAREVRTPDRMLLLRLAVEWSPEVHRLSTAGICFVSTTPTCHFLPSRSPRSSRRRLKGSLSGLSPWAPPWMTWISTWRPR